MSSNNPPPFLPLGSVSSRSSAGGNNVNQANNSDRALSARGANDEVQVDVSITTSTSANAAAPNLASATALMEDVSDVPAVDHARLELQKEVVDVDMDGDNVDAAGPTALPPATPSHAAVQFSSRYQAEGVPLTERHMELMNQLAGGSSNCADDNGVAASSSSSGSSSGAVDWPVPHVPATWPEYMQARASNRALPGVLPPLDTYPSSSLTGVVYDLRMMLHAPLGWRPSSNDDDDDSDSDDSDADGQAQRHRETHPEEPRRIQRIYEQLRRKGVIKDAEDGGRTRMVPCVEATREEVCTVHDENVWLLSEATKTMPHEIINRDYYLYEHHSLYINNHTALAARLSCGGVTNACRAVVAAKVRNAIAIVRPPGHHAEPDQSMGFCMFNNVAVAARVVQQEIGVKRVMILDWDVHHGNGTQRAFYQDPDILYVSIHRHDGGKFYPASDYGGLDVVGSGAGAGKSVNIPWPTGGFGDADYLYAMQRIVMPIAYEFAPELVIISAGFDAAEGDQLGGCKVTPAGYAHITHMMSSLAGGKLVVALEGGYNLTAISNSAEAVARVMTGEPLPELAPMQASALATEVVFQVAKVQSRYWKCIDVKACEPLEELADLTSDSVFMIPDIIKSHRAKTLYEKHKMFPIPLGDALLDAQFPDQIMTDGRIYETKTTVMFVHDFGNLQVEAATTLTTDVDLEKSKLIDSSNKVIDWAKSRGYGLLDVNILKALPTEPQQVNSVIAKKAPKEWVKLMKVLWDTLIALTRAENVILFGYGTGCQAIMGLINDRDVESLVSTVIQVGGMHSFVRPDPFDDSKRAWCRKHSRVYVSESHPLVEDPIIAKRLSAEIITLRECTLSQSPHAVANVLLFAAVPRAIDMLNAALPLVDKFVDDTIEKRRLAVAKDKARMEEERKAAEGPVLPSRIVPTRWYMDSVEI